MLRRALRIIVTVILCCAALVECAAWASVIAEGEGRGESTGLVLGVSTLGLIVGMSLQVVIHELGHLVAARTMRLRVLGVRIGWLQLGVTRTRVARSSGHVMVDLRLPERALPARMAVFVAAGPLANVATAAMAGVVASTDGVPVAIRVVAVGFTIAGVLAGVLNLVPHRLTSTTASDGLALLRWVFRPSSELAKIPGMRERSTLRPIYPPS